MNTGTIPSSRTQTLCAGAVFLAALVLYSWTLAPTVTLTDSGELIVVAYGLGVAHPPGVPLWALLAYLASLAPLGNVAVRINFSSALFAALASAMLTLVVAELMITASYLAASKRGKKGARSGAKRLCVTLLREQGTRIQASAAFWCLRLRSARGCSWRSPARFGLMRPSPRFILSTRCLSSLSSF